MTYPTLFLLQLIEEMCRITGTGSDLRDSAQKNWKRIAPKVVQQAQLEASHNSHVAATLKKMDIDSSNPGKFNIHPSCACQCLYGLACYIIQYVSK